MKKKNFHITISQSNDDDNDYAIHLKEHGRKEKTLAHLFFDDDYRIDNHYIMTLINDLTKKLSNRIKHYNKFSSCKIYKIENYRDISI